MAAGPLDKDQTTDRMACKVPFVRESMCQRKAAANRIRPAFEIGMAIGHEWAHGLGAPDMRDPGPI